jgi:hypothetical protein
MSKARPPEMLLRVVDTIVSFADQRHATDRTMPWEVSEPELADIRRVCRGEKPRTKLGRSAWQAVQERDDAD